MWCPSRISGRIIATMTTVCDYLLVGHVSQDLQSDGTYKLGGTVSFAAFTVAALGLQPAVLTSMASDWDAGALAPYIRGITPAAANTVFENRYQGEHRTQLLHSRAAVLHPDQFAPLPAARVLHLGPLDRELDAAWFSPARAAFVGLTGHGMLRQWDAHGRVTPADWPEAEQHLPRLNAVAISIEDIAGDWAMARRWAALTPLLVVTRGSHGARLFQRGRQPIDVPAPEVALREATGAGDVFSAVLFALLAARVPAVEATRHAVRVASRWVASGDLARLAECARDVPLPPAYQHRSATRLPQPRRKK